MLLSLWNIAICYSNPICLVHRAHLGNTSYPLGPPYVLWSSFWFYNNNKTSNIFECFWTFLVFVLTFHIVTFFCEWRLPLWWYVVWKVLLTFHNSQSTLTVENSFQSYLYYKLHWYKTFKYVLIGQTVWSQDDKIVCPFHVVISYP